MPLLVPTLTHYSAEVSSFSFFFLFISLSFLLSFVLLLYCYPPRIAPLVVGNIIVNVVYIEQIVVVEVLPTFR